MLQKARNASIDIFRYIAAILVVSLHVTAFSDIHPTISYLFSQILPRISVPFFFTVSGYYFTSKLEQKTANPKKYISKLLVTYTLWSGLYYIIDFITERTVNINQLLYSFFISGSAYHFWYFPAIIISTLLTTVIFRIRCQKILIPLSMVLYIVACLGNGYYNIGCQIPFISTLYSDSTLNDVFHVLCPGFSYFICGYLIYKTEPHISRLRNQTKLILLLLSFMLFFGEIILLKTLDWAGNISVTIGLYVLVYFLMILLLNNPMPQYQSLSLKCQKLANFTYYSHIMIITLITTCLKAFWDIRLPETLMFGIVIVFTFILGTVLSKSKYSFIKLFLV